MAMNPSRAYKPGRTQGYGIIYVIKSELLEAHKIGITNDWSRRKRELKVGVSTSAVHVARINNAGSLETYLHSKFQHSRLPQSEWFRLDENDLTFVRSAIRKAKDDYEQSQKASSNSSSKLNQGEATGEYSHRSSPMQDSARPRNTETGHERVVETRTVEPPKPSSVSNNGYWNDPKRKQKEARYSLHHKIILIGIIGYPLTAIIRGLVSGQLSTMGALSYLILLIVVGIPFGFFPSLFMAFLSASIHDRIDPIH
jgi:hypothetical protein